MTSATPPSNGIRNTRSGLILLRDVSSLVPALFRLGVFPTERLAFACTESAVQVELSWTTCASPILPPDDTGTVAVIDGSKPHPSPLLSSPFSNSLFSSRINAHNTLPNPKRPPTHVLPPTCPISTRQRPRTRAAARTTGCRTSSTSEFNGGTA